MTAPLKRPKRKNPVLRTRLPTLPPGGRSRVALGMTAAAAEGRFELQVCGDCGAVQYPPREACHALPVGRARRGRAGRRRRTARQTTVLHHSNDLFFRERLPWRLGLVRLDAGPTRGGCTCMATCARRAGARAASARASTAPARRC